MIAQTANYYLPVFLLHSMWQNWVMGPEKQQVYYKGFVVRDIVNLTPAETTWKRPTGKKKYLQLSDFIWTESLKMCKEEGSSVILYSAPSPHNYNYAKHNTLTEYAEQMGAAYGFQSDDRGTGY